MANNPLQSYLPKEFRSIGTTTTKKAKAKSVADLLGYSEDAGRILRSAGVDTSSVEKPKEFPVWTLLRNIGQIAGATNNEYAVKRFFENMQGKRYKPGEIEELTWGSYIPSALFGAGAGLAAITGPNPVSLGLMGAGGALTGGMWLRDKLVGNRYLTYDKQVELAGSDSLSHSVLTSLAPGLAHNKVAQFVTGVGVSGAVDPTTYFRGGIKTATQAGLASMMTRFADDGIDVADLIHAGLIRSFDPDEVTIFLKALGTLPDDMIARIVEFMPKFEHAVNLTAKDLSLIDGVGRTTIPPGAIMGSEFREEFYNGIRKFAYQELGDLGGLKFFGKTIVDSQPYTDALAQKIKWAILNEPETAGYLGTAKKVLRDSMNYYRRHFKRDFGLFTEVEKVRQTQNIPGSDMFDAYLSSIRKRSSEALVGFGNDGEKVLHGLYNILGDDAELRHLTGLYVQLSYGKIDSDGLKLLKKTLDDIQALSKEYSAKALALGIDPKTYKEKGKSAVGYLRLARRKHKEVDADFIHRVEDSTVELESLRQQILDLESKINHLKTDVLRPAGRELQKKFLDTVGPERAAKIEAAAEYYRVAMARLLEDENKHGRYLPDFLGFSGDLPDEYKSLGYLYGKAYDYRKAPEEFDIVKDMLDKYGELIGANGDSSLLNLMHDTPESRYSRIRKMAFDEGSKTHIFPIMRLRDVDTEGIWTDFDIMRLTGNRYSKAATRNFRNSLKANLSMAFGVPLGYEEYELGKSIDGAVFRTAAGDIVGHGDDVARAALAFSNELRGPGERDRVIAEILTKISTSWDTDDVVDLYSKLDLKTLGNTPHGKLMRGIKQILGGKGGKSRTEAIAKIREGLAAVSPEQRPAIAAAINRMVRKSSLDSDDILSQIYDTVKAADMAEMPVPRFSAKPAVAFAADEGIPVNYFDGPGVYIIKNREGDEVLYVGSSLNTRSRITAYPNDMRLDQGFREAMDYVKKNGGQVQQLLMDRGFGGDPHIRALEDMVINGRYNNVLGVADDIRPKANSRRVSQSLKYYAPIEEASKLVNDVVEIGDTDADTLLGVIQTVTNSARLTGVQGVRGAGVKERLRSTLGDIIMGTGRNLDELIEAAPDNVVLRYLDLLNTFVGHGYDFALAESKYNELARTFKLLYANGANGDDVYKVMSASLKNLGLSSLERETFARAAMEGHGPELVRSARIDWSPIKKIVDLGASWLRGGDEAPFYVIIGRSDDIGGMDLRLVMKTRSGEDGLWPYLQMVHRIDNIRVIEMPVPGVSTPFASMSEAAKGAAPLLSDLSRSNTGIRNAFDDWVRSGDNVLPPPWASRQIAFNEVVVPELGYAVDGAAIYDKMMDTEVIGGVTAQNILQRVRNFAKKTDEVGNPAPQNLESVLQKTLADLGITRAYLAKNPDARHALTLVHDQIMFYDTVEKHLMDYFVSGRTDGPEEFVKEVVLDLKNRGISVPSAAVSRMSTYVNEAIGSFRTTAETTLNAADKARAKQIARSAKQALVQKTKGGKRYGDYLDKLWDTVHALRSPVDPKKSSPYIDALEWLMIYSRESGIGLEEIISSKGSSDLLYEFPLWLEARGMKSAGEIAKDARLGLLQLTGKAATPNTAAKMYPMIRVGTTTTRNMIERSEWIKVAAHGFDDELEELAMRILFEAGMRPIELSETLGRVTVDVDKNLIIYTAAKRGGNRIQRVAVPISHDANGKRILELFAKHGSSGKSIIPDSFKAAGRTRDSVTAALRRAVARTPDHDPVLDEISGTWARHSAATRWVREGLSPGEVAKRLGDDTSWIARNNYIVLSAEDVPIGLHDVVFGSRRPTTLEGMFEAGLDKSLVNNSLLQRDYFGKLDRVLADGQPIPEITRTPAEATSWAAREGMHIPDMTDFDSMDFVTDEQKNIAAHLTSGVLPPGHKGESVNIGNLRVHYAVPKYVDDMVARMTEIVDKPEGFKDMFGLLDKGLMMWKRQATVLRIGFHTRNKLSNMILMSLHGMFDPANWAKAPAWLTGGIDENEILDFTGNESVRQLLGTYTPTVAEVLRLADDRRVTPGALEVAELLRQRMSTRMRPSSAAEALKMGKGFNLFSGESKPAKVMEYLGTNWVEDADRLATFVTALQRGMNVDAATDMVNRVLYDYSPLALSRLESTWMKLIFPFYNWMKNNTPTMAELIVKQPGIFRNLMRLSNASYEVQGADRTIIPDYLRQSSPTFMLPIKDSRGNNIIISMAMPIADISRVMSPNEILSSTNPFFKSLLEYMQNYDLYYQKPIEAVPGQTKRAPTYLYPLDWALSNRISGKAWEPIKSALGITDKTDTTTGKKYLAAPAYSVKFLKDFFPIFNTFSKMGIDPLEEPSQSVSDVLSETIGIKVSPYNRDELERYRAYEQFAGMQQLLSAAHQQGKTTTTVGELRKSEKKNSGQKELNRILGISN